MFSGLLGRNGKSKTSRSPGCFRLPDASAGNLVDELLPLLKSAQQEILRLAYWDGLSSEEMATVLGISANSARVRLHRAREAFRRAAAKSGSALGPVQELEA